MSKLVTIKSFLTTMEAHLLKVQLAEEDIKCFLKNENIVNTHALFSENLGQIDLQVNEQDAEKATKIINNG